MKKRLGELLIERGVITPTQLKDALSLQRRKGLRLGDALVRLGHLSEPELVKTLSAVLNLRAVDLTDVVPKKDALGLVRPGFALDHNLIPLEVHLDRAAKTLIVAMADPLNAQVVDELRFMTGCRLELVLATPTSIHDLVRRAYGAHRVWTEGRPVPDYVTVESEDDTMTIVRGGKEEVVRTFSGPNPSSPPTADEALDYEDEEPRPRAPSQPAPRRTVPPTIQGLPERGPPTVAGMPLPPIPGTPSQPPPSGIDLSTRAGLPQYPSQAPPAGRITQLTDHYGVLVGSSGGVVDAEAFLTLERRFWALLRVLVKKGLMTPEEFMAEMRED